MKTLDLPLELSMLSVRFPEIDVLFPVSAATMSFPAIVFELAQLAMVDNPGFAFGISMLSVTVLEILAFPVWRSHLLVDIFVEFAVIENRFCRQNYNAGGRPIFGFISQHERKFR